jgi:hypothetical protein
MFDKVTISQDEYDSLKEDEKLLDCLRICGVDNWDGFDDAHNMFEEGGV